MRSGANTAKIAKVVERGVWQKGVAGVEDGTSDGFRESRASAEGRGWMESAAWGCETRRCSERVEGSKKETGDGARSAAEGSGCEDRTPEQESSDKAEAQRRRPEIWASTRVLAIRAAPQPTGLCSSGPLAHVSAFWRPVASAPPGPVDRRATGTPSAVVLQGASRSHAQTHAMQTPEHCAHADERLTGLRSFASFLGATCV
ncbi:hypothetical protein COCC4DRAFT_55506 [Bipolaris maydis ATCC 48331]|uniref:Uncharacterized protein n=2 Tax=Cochliobolus heterostrophus TaxID=5016 RepID=M2UBP1_COCH5|nr:uncharacterized protein COCC4DRAFT_55506 [Bipolaris maydis ATCC 48331]EMD95984.1 hypothetical protein COCHEDRAFT_1026783 [Bipolaris maydis C5]KAH7561868.1 hypothetical protein BM1_02972 [Bipolaris maydis]ENI10842.1 hypothetical protein COCC4DRAFT_55506 [Bipolaris maydis ATCC 48331]KAJ5030691.1 hypothetical protein J3E73DRAFT_420756 [Bipolaris maydis]KAJ6213234.1 hypothetical protein PSV09DRAFT_1026783 [Bipolaris maydis]